MVYAILEINPQNLDLNKEEDKEKKDVWDFLRTTLGAKCILKEMATRSHPTIEEGYGVLRPFEKVFEDNDKFRAAVNNAYRYRKR